MTENEWLINQLKDYQKRQITYEKQAFFQELEAVISEQYKRIEQAKNELDGHLWSPKKW